MRNW
ncbi:hypothetical protein H824_YJM1450G00425 [Saccharomyces cerevisiae YJM1450]|jgi:hypothetical protein